jgi:hypothetical protein
MRLHAITGSLSAIDAVASAKASSEVISADHLQDVLGQFAGAIKRIHGDASFTNQDAGKFVHATSQFIGILSASSDIQGGADLDLAGNADIAGTSDLHGAVHAFGTLDVDAEATLASAIVQDLTDGRIVLAGTGGALVDSANLTFDGSELAILGAVSGSGNFEVGGTLTVAGTSSLNGEVTMASAVVSDLTNGRVALVGASGALVDDAQITHSAGQLTVSGSTFSKDVSIVRDLTVGRDLSAVSGSFSGDLVVTGDLVVNGTTTTVNSTVVTVDDKAIELGATASPSDMTADGGGIILKGSSDKTILWQQASGAWEMNDDLLPSADNSYDLGSDAKRWQDLFLEGSADVDGNMDVAGTLTVGGIVDLNGALSASLIKIDGDTATRLYIVDADGSMKDEANLTYKTDWNSGMSLHVDGGLVQSGSVVDLFGKSITLTSDENSTWYVNNDFTLSTVGNVGISGGTVQVYGSSLFHNSLEVDGIANLDANVYAAQGLYLSGAADFASTLAVADHVTLDKAADQSILKVGGDLHVSASADVRLEAGGLVKLVDQYRAASTWSDAEGIKLASSAAEWTNFKATFGGEVSLLAALTGGGSGGKFKAEIASTSPNLAAASILDVTDGVTGFGAKWASIVEPRVAKVDVFVNGQLMVSGSGKDYLVDSAGDFTFSFDLVADDIVMALVR